jgi:hypothetical protein
VIKDGYDNLFVIIGELISDLLDEDLQTLFNIILPEEGCVENDSSVCFFDL